MYSCLLCKCLECRTKIVNEKVGIKKGSKTKRNADNRKIKNSGDMAPNMSAGEVGGHNVNEFESHGRKKSASNCATRSNGKSSAF